MSLIAVFALSHAPPCNFHWSACTVIPFILTVAAAACADAQRKASPFRDPYAVYLGAISFALGVVLAASLVGAARWRRTNGWRSPG